MDAIFETNFRFHVKWQTMAKVHHLLSGNFLLVLTKSLFEEEIWALSCNLKQFGDLPEIS